ncbi:unnamed protein product [Meloidogyne enterolobii]|uniref:Uncharacterized protein n=2 Tax=Meloidogyne enterolobii TaxID=390850 RepID=A0ACB0ZMX3_MELEN
MDGQETVYGSATNASPASLTMLDEHGFEFIERCINVIEEKGITEQGIYRNCGVNSKVQKLMQHALDPHHHNKRSASDKLNLLTDSDLELKTVSSAIKTFLRNLPEPLMTYELHQHFINAAKLHDGNQRVQHIHYWVYKLPSSQKNMLEMVIKHLRRVSNHSSENLMSISNLAVCFGPTLLRPREETLAAVMDIKFCNVVVEALIANCEHIFGKQPPQQIEQPFPPKPAKSGQLLTTINNEGGGGGSILGDDKSLSSSKSSGGGYDDLLPMTQQNRPLKPTITPFNSTDGTTLSSNNPNHQQFPPPTSPQRRPFNGGGGGNTTLKQKPSIISKQFESRSELCLAGSGVLGDSPSSSSTPPPSSSGANKQLAGIAPRGKTFGSYAPMYSQPLPTENIYATLRTSPSKTPLTTQQQQRPSSSSSQQSTTTSATPIILSNRSETLPQTTILSMRIPPAYTNFINPDGPLHPPRRVRTIYPCEAGHETELSFESGQIITNVYESKEEGWLVGTLNGKTGLIPANYVTYVDNF